MPWGFRRKLLYTSVVAVIAGAALIWAAFAVFSRPATCSDGKENGKETGIDCGGPCARVCAGDAREPVLKWQRVLQTGESLYTAAAYIQNPNAAGGMGAYNVRYSFRLLDSDNLLIAERSGTVDIPPIQELPIIETNIAVGERQVAHVFFSFSGDMTWTKIPSDSIPHLRFSNQSVSQSDRTVTATVSNEGVREVRDLMVAAILSDEDNTIQGVSKSLISRIPAGGSKEVTFTWNNEISSAVRARIISIPALPPVSSL